MPYPHRPALTALLVAFAPPLCSCVGPDVDQPGSDTSFYALVEGVDGVFFYPPLGPDPQASGTFEGSLLDGLSVTLEVQEADGATTVLGRFDQATSPAVALLADHERYGVNIPAATYLTDSSRTYQIRTLLDGTELGTSVLSARVFNFIGWNPQLTIGVQVRVEGSGAVRDAQRARFSGTRPRSHCSDGAQNKDETGVDCGGSCGACECFTPGGFDAYPRGCGWYQVTRASLMATCQADAYAAMTAYNLVATRTAVHPDPSSWLDLWTTYWCPSYAPNGVRQPPNTGGTGYRCFAQCPAGTVATAAGCACL